MTPFMAAAAEGHVGVVKMLLPHMGGHYLDNRDYEGKTALHYASETGHEAMVALLMSQGAEADITNQYGETLLMLGAVGGHLGVVKMLLQHMGGQGLDQTDYEGRTALYCAVWGGHEEMVAFLMSQGAQLEITDQTGMTPFIMAACNGHVGVVKMLLHHMGGLRLSEADIYGRTALHHAAQKGHGEILAFLLSQGAQLDITANCGMTLLMAAASRGHVHVAKMLLQHMKGLGLDERDHRGWTALYCAASGGHAEMVAFLMSQGAKVDITDEYGMTPFIAAADGGHVGVVRMLLQHVGGQGLDETDNMGGTALHHASDRGNEEIVRALLFAGADHTITDHKGRTSRAVAGIMRRQGCVEVFKVSRQEHVSNTQSDADRYAYPYSSG
jgi:ankyrin repeat protein